MRVSVSPSAYFISESIHELQFKSYTMNWIPAQYIYLN